MHQNDGALLVSGGRRKLMVDVIADGERQLPYPSRQPAHKEAGGGEEQAGGNRASESNDSGPQ